MRGPTRHPPGNRRQIGARLVKGDRLPWQENTSSTAIFLLAVPAALAGTAAAQTTSGLEEIIVTAQKREQSLQDVGIAVTAFSDKQIRELGFTDSDRRRGDDAGAQLHDAKRRVERHQLLPARRRV